MKTTLLDGLREMNIDLPDSAVDALCLYGERLTQKNGDINLTSITDAPSVASLHFLDSLSILSVADLLGKRLIDVGCGAGFPGLPLKIAVPELDLTLLDSTGKRIDWLRELCAELRVDADCIHARAEEQAHLEGNRESYDFAVSRAVARLNVLSELCLPYCRVGGNFIAMKSVESDEEVEQALPAIRLMGGELADCRDYPVPGTDIIHRLVIIKKVKGTPAGYPRRFARIKKEPVQ